MSIEKEGTGSPEKESKKKFKIGIEMESYGKDGKEITGGDLWEDVEVEVANEDEARDIVFNKMDFGNRIPNGYSEVEEVGKPKEEPPFQGVRLGKKTGELKSHKKSQINITNQHNTMKKEQISTSHEEEMTPEELKKEAMYELGHVAHERQFRMDRYQVEKIVAGWELFDEEIKKLALASFPDVAIALLDAKINKE